MLSTPSGNTAIEEKQMTNKEAIKQLEELIQDRQNHVCEDDDIWWSEMWLRDIEALKIAISAIKQLEETNNV